MIVAVMHLGLHLFASDSLKEKRRVVTSVKTRLRNRFNLSVCELDAPGSWTEAELALAVVAGDKPQVDRVVDQVTRWLDGDGRFELVQRVVEYF